MNIPLYTSCALSSECFANRCSFCPDPTCGCDCHEDQEWTGTAWESMWSGIDWSDEYEPELDHRLSERNPQ